MKILLLASFLISTPTFAQKADLKLEACLMHIDESSIECGDKSYALSASEKIKMAKPIDDDLPDFCHSKRVELKSICDQWKNAGESWRDSSISGFEFKAGLERQASDILLSGCVMADDEKSVQCGKRKYVISAGVVTSDRGNSKANMVDTSKKGDTHKTSVKKE
jgi:hypothetical protein